MAATITILIKISCLDNNDRNKNEVLQKILLKWDKLFLLKEYHRDETITIKHHENNIIFRTENGTEYKAGALII